jgi:hypothetical protein
LKGAERLISCSITKLFWIKTIIILKKTWDNDLKWSTLKKVSKISEYFEKNTSKLHYRKQSIFIRSKRFFEKREYSYIVKNVRFYHVRVLSTFFANTIQNEDLSAPVLSFDFAVLNFERRLFHIVYNL